MDYMEMSIWRRADYDECKKVEEYANQALKAKKTRCLINAGWVELLVVFNALFWGAVRVEGEQKPMKGVIIFLVGTLIVAGIGHLFISFSMKRVKAISEQKFMVTDATVVDRKRIESRRFDDGSYVTVKYGDEEKPEEKEFMVLDSAYDDCKLGTELLLVKYNEDTYVEGFYDAYDLVIK